MARQSENDWHPWFKAAIDCGRRLGSFYVVAYGSPQWEAWRNYFERISFMPVTFRRMDHGSSWTAPAQWPSMLDFTLPEFPPQDVPHLVVKPLRQRVELTQAELDAQFARLGLSHLRPGSKCRAAGPPRHSDDERQRAQEFLDRAAAEAQRQPQKEAAE